MKVTSEGPVKFVVTLYKCDAAGCDNPLDLLSGSPHFDIEVLFSKLSSQSRFDEQGCREEEWTYFVRLKDVDAFEQAIARCHEVISYERCLIHGDCARSKTFFSRCFRVD
jgi:hypothetical protein